MVLMRRLSLLLVMLSLVLAACGDGDDSSTEPATADGADDAATEPAAPATDGADAAAPSEPSGTSAPSGAGDVELINEGQLTVCTDSPYQPFEFEEDGEFTGFDVGVMNAIADELSLETEYRVTPFEGIQSGAALAANQCDIAASAMTITEERRENLAFSEPYFDAEQSLMVPADSDVTSLEDLAGQGIGVQASTTGAAYAQENAPEDAQVVEYPDSATLFTALQGGEVAAALQDFPVNGYFSTQNEGFEVVEQYPTGEQYGFATAIGKEPLIEQVNMALASVRDSGTYDEIYSEWFGSSGGSE